MRSLLISLKSGEGHLNNLLIIGLSNIKLDGDKLTIFCKFQEEIDQYKNDLKEFYSSDHNAYLFRGFIIRIEKVC